MRSPGAVSPIGGKLKGWNFVRSKVTWPERNCIIIYMYSRRNGKLGWFEMRQQNFIVCEPKFTNVSAFSVKSIVVVNAVFRLSISVSVLEIYATKVKSCPKTRELSMLGKSK